MKTRQEILDLFSFFCELDAGRTSEVIQSLLAHTPHLPIFV